MISLSPPHFHCRSRFVEVVPQRYAPPWSSIPLPANEEAENDEVQDQHDQGDGPEIRATDEGGSPHHLARISATDPDIAARLALLRQDEERGEGEGPPEP